MDRDTVITKSDPQDWNFCCGPGRGIGLPAVALPMGMTATLQDLLNIL
jgi:hypothetical protein